MVENFISFSSVIGDDVIDAISFFFTSFLPFLSYFFRENMEVGGRHCQVE